MPPMMAYILHDRYSDPEAGQISSYFCQLFILVAEDSVQYCLLDTERNKFIALADYRLPEAEKPTGISYALFDRLISEEELLRKKYPSVVIGFHTPFHTLVPSSLYDSSHLSEYLEFNFRFPEGYFITSDRAEEIDSYNISGIPVAFKEFISRHFAGSLLVHGFTPLIKAAFQHHKDNPGTAHLYLNIRKYELDLILFEGSRPLFINTYPYKNKEDILYFTLTVIGQNATRQDQLQLVISGMVEEGSETWVLLGQYIGQVVLAPRLAVFIYSPLLEQAPAHRYQDLFALALCGS
jgi:hypothetical protein